MDLALSNVCLYFHQLFDVENKSHKKIKVSLGDVEELPAVEFD